MKFESIYPPVVTPYHPDSSITGDETFGHLLAIVIVSSADEAVQVANDTPFGGYKQSGFGGRDNSLHAHDQYTELKTIWLDVSDTAVKEAID